jgi:hypothetical protein
MTISNILEHWATIYKPLSHKPESGRLEDQSFFRIRYIDLENIFSRNANIIHSPCMLQSVTSTGELKGTRKAEVSHQVWLLSKVKDTAQTLGRFDGLKLEQAANDLVEYCEDLASWLLEVKRTGKCPVTNRSFADDAQLLAELKAIDADSISYGVVPDLYSGQWLIAGIDWRSTKPLYRFGCNGNGKYITQKE